MPDCKVIQIREHEWRIEDDTVRVFLFEGAERALLVDSGKTLDNMYQIVRELTTLPIQLVNTHVDFDHIACNEQFEAAYPTAFVQQRFEQITSSHIEKVLDGISENTTRVWNTKAYLLAALFNAPSSTDNHYTMRVNHDFYHDYGG